MSNEKDLFGLLQRQAEERPDKPFLRFRERDWTFREFHDLVEVRAAALAGALGDAWVTPARGVSGRPTILPALLPNCPEAVELWFAAHRAGWVWAPINTQFKGQGLAHAINLTESPALVVDQSLLCNVMDVFADLEHLTTIVLRRSSAEADGTSSAGTLTLPGGIRLIELDDLPQPSESLKPLACDSERTALMIYTSGTTGPSKACELSGYYVVEQGALLGRCLEIRESDVLFCPYPLFHWDATIGTIVPALIHGVPAAIGERFSASGFWRDVQDFGVTVFDFMGATLGFLHKKEPHEDDAKTPARLGWGVPMPAFKAGFERRFDLTLVEGYGSTEGGVMVFQTLGKDYPVGSCGEALPEFEIRIVDEGGFPLREGEVGEITVRTAEPSSRLLMMSGYYRMPQETSEAFRDGWFHTGDLGRLDADGNLFFEGRKKDAIRRRGENISAFEVEQVVEGHPAVLEAAAYGVPSEHTEEEVALAVRLRPGRTLTVEGLLSHCRERMAPHMVPFHVRFVEHLPKTPTEKVAKRVLREWYQAHVRGERPDQDA